MAIMMYNIVFLFLFYSIICHSYYSWQYSFSYPIVTQIPYHIVPFNLSFLEKNERWIHHCRNKTIVRSIDYRQSLFSVILIMSIIIILHSTTLHSLMISISPHFVLNSILILIMYSLDPKKTQSIKFYQMSFQKEDTIHTCL